MKSFKLSTISYLLLVLATTGSTFASKNCDPCKKLDPLVGTWVGELGAFLPEDGMCPSNNPAGPASQVQVIFHDDCTLSANIAFVNQAGEGISFSAGVWERVSERCYKIALWGPANLVGAPLLTVRSKITGTVKLEGNLCQQPKTLTFTGQYFTQNLPKDPNCKGDALALCLAGGATRGTTCEKNC